MKNVKFSRRSFLKAGAAASVASLVAANAAVASAAEPYVGKALSLQSREADAWIASH